MRAFLVGISLVVPYINIIRIVRANAGRGCPRVAFSWACRSWHRSFRVCESPDRFPGRFCQYVVSSGHDPVGEIGPYDFAMLAVHDAIILWEILVFIDFYDRIIVS